MRVVRKALTFDDVLLVPAHSEVLPREVASRPASPAGSPQHPARVRGHGHGHRGAPRHRHGPGGRHRHPPQEPGARRAGGRGGEGQALRERHGQRPVTVPPTMSRPRGARLMQQHKISGLPVVEGASVVGILTDRDLRFETNLDQPVSAIMTKASAGHRARGHRRETREGADAPAPHRALLVVDGEQARGLITVKDILKATEHPIACKDELGRLRVGAAIGVGARQRRARRGCWSPPASTSSSSTPRTATRRACSTACVGEEALPAACRSSPATSRPPPARGAHRRRRRRREGRHRPGLDLHHARRRRRRRAADHRRSRWRSRASRRAGVPLIADGGIRYSGDIAKAHRRRRVVRHDRQPVRRHRRVARRDRALPGPLVQDLPRHGLAGRDAAGQRRPLLPGARGRGPIAPPRSSCPRASRAACRTRARWSTSSTS